MLLSPGNSVHTVRFAVWLSSMGHEVILVDPLAIPTSGPGAVSHLPYPDGFSRLRKLLGKNGEFLRWVELRLLWQKMRPDLVHLHWVDRRLLDCWRAKLRPLVVTCWGSDLARLSDNTAAGKNKSIGRALSWADHIFADSIEVLRQCEGLAQHQLPASWMLLGIDTEKFAPGYPEEASRLRQSLKIENDAFVVLSVRGLKRLYQHEKIVEAFARAKEQIGGTWCLLLKRFLADDRGYQAELESLVKKLAIETSVRWLDELEYDQMPVLYNLADVVVNFPERDAFPVSLLEASACGTLVVTSGLPAYEPYLAGGFSIPVFSADVDELTLSLCAARSHLGELRAQKARDARAWVLEHGDERQSRRQLEEVYSQVTGRN